MQEQNVDEIDTQIHVRQLHLCHSVQWHTHTVVSTVNNKYDIQRRRCLDGIIITRSTNFTSWSNKKAKNCTKKSYRFFFFSFVIFLLLFLIRFSTVFLCYDGDEK